MRKMRAKDMVIFGITALVMLFGGLLAVYHIMFNPLKVSNASSEVGFDVTISTSSNSTGSYANSEGDSYNSQYGTSKSQITVQFYDVDTNALADTYTFENLWGSSSSSNYTTGVTHSFGSLTLGKYYKVYINAPAFMRYNVTYYIEQPSSTNASGSYNEFSNVNTFMIYRGETQLLSIEVWGIEDDSWISNYN